MTLSSSSKIFRRWSGLRLLLTVAGLASLSTLGFYLALLRFHLPAPTGPYPVGTRTLYATDTSRHDDEATDSAERRQLVVQLWYPAAPSSNALARYQRWQETKLTGRYTALLRTNSRTDAPFAATVAPAPVLLFGPRWTGERTQNTDLAEELASHGYLVAAVDHPYNASRAMLGDGKVIAANPPLEGPKGDTANAEERIAYWNRTLATWTADDLFVLNQLAKLDADPASPLHGRIDTGHVGAFGHSFGGAASLALCGLDPRVKAAINMDGWTFGGLATRTAAQQVMVLYEQYGADRNKELLTLPQPGTVEDQLDRADNAVIERSLREYGGYRLYVGGAQHLDFSDQPLLPPLHRGSFTGPIAPLEMQTIVRQYILGFFDQTLRNKPSPLLNENGSPFPEVRVEQWHGAAR